MITRDTTWVGLTQVARELGVTRRAAEKQLRRFRWAYPPEGDPRHWDARVIDLIHALHGRPHRTLEPAHQDWLARYLRGET